MHFRRCHLDLVLRGLFVTWLAHVVAGGGPVAAQGPETPQTSPKSAPAALAIYSDAANLQNNREFDLAIEQWSALLKDFADDPLADRARHYLGICQLQLKQYDKAAQTLSSLVAANPKFEFLEDTYLNLGWAQYAHALAGHPDWLPKAEASFAALADKFPQGPYVDQALFYRGESLYQQNKRREALACYHRLMQEHAQSKLLADAVYALSVTHQELEEYAQAGELFDRFLKEFPQHQLVSEVRMRSGEVSLAQGNPARAEELFGQAAKAEGFASADYAALRQAYAAALQEKHPRAAELYARVVEQFPQSRHLAEAVMSAGRSFYRAGDFPQAEKWLQRTVQSGDQNAVEAAHWLCRIWLKQKQPARAAQLAASLLPQARKGPHLVHLKLDQADALFELPDRRAESLELYRQIAQQHHDDPLAAQALYNAAYAALDLKRFDDGIELTERFLQQHAKDTLLPDVLYVQAECLLLKQRYAEAEKVYQRLLADHAAHAEAATWRLRYAAAAYAQQQYQQTADVLSATAGKLPTAATNAEAHFLLGLAYLQLGRPEEAAKALEASVAADPQWRQADEALLNLARAWQKANRLDDAKGVLSRLIAEFPQSNQLAAAHSQLAQAAFASQDFQAAAAEYALVTANWPESPLVPHALYGRAWALVRAGNYQQAIQPLNELIAKFAEDPLIPQAYQARAVCHQRTGKFQEGVADVDRFLQYSPPRGDRSAALYVRGLCEMGLKQTDAAISTFQSILNEDAGYARADQVLYELAWAHKTRKQPDEARELFRRLAETHPTSALAPEAHFHVGQWHYDRGEYDPALAAYNLALKGSPAADLREKILYKIGWTNFQQKQYQLALQAFTQQLAAYASGPLAADGLFMKAECLFQLEDYAQALPAFKNAGAARPASETMAVLTLLHGGQSAGQLGNWDEALKWLTRLSDKYPESPYLAEALYEQGWALQQMGRINEARERYQRVTDTSRTAVGARARFMLGELYFEQKQFDSAIREFRLLIYGYGGDQAHDDIKPWQAKGGLEAGRCAAVLAGQTPAGQTRQSYLDSAKKYLSYVCEKHPQSEEAAAAAQQLKQYGT